MCRTFMSFENAFASICRDVYKSPEVHSGRVQQFVDRPMIANEALNYQWQIDGSLIPEDPEAILRIAEANLPFYQKPKNRAMTLDWMVRQRDERLGADEVDTLDETFVPADTKHPVLRALKSSTALNKQTGYDYLYAERLRGMMDEVTESLSADDSSRRMFWPIFDVQDTPFIHENVRIPCSLGYSYIIREVPLLGQQLHFTYLQRSADLEIFFITDVWLANQFQRLAASVLGVELGVFTHNILSLHRFHREGLEIY